MDKYTRVNLPIKTL